MAGAAYYGCGAVTIPLQRSSGVTPAVDLVLFSANPTGSTITDHSAVAIVAADLGKVVGVMHLTDATALGSTSVMQSQQQALPFILAAGSSTLYATIITRSTAVLTSTSDMTVTIQVLLH